MDPKGFQKIRESECSSHLTSCFVQFQDVDVSWGWWPPLHPGRCWSSQLWIWVLSIVSGWLPWMMPSATATCQCRSSLASALEDVLVKVHKHHRPSILHTCTLLVHVAMMLDDAKWRIPLAELSLNHNGKYGKSMKEQEMVMREWWILRSHTLIYDVCVCVCVCVCWPL